MFWRKNHVHWRFRKFFRRFRKKKFWGQNDSNLTFRLEFELHPRYFSSKLKKCVSLALKSFWWVEWYCHCYQSISLGLKNIKNNYNMSRKCIDRDLESKTQTEYFFKKLFWKTSKYCTKNSQFKKSFFKKLRKLFSQLYITIYTFVAHVVIIFYVP